MNAICEELGGSTDTDFSNGCPLPCLERGACCINNFCYDYTEYELKDLYDILSQVSQAIELKEQEEEENN